MDAPGLGDVVGRLFLWEIGNVAGHGGSNDERAFAASFEVMADSLCAMEAAGKIRLDDFLPVFHRAIKDPRIGGAASIGNEGVNLWFRHVSLGSRNVERDATKLFKNKTQWYG